MRVNVQLAVDVGDVRLHCAVREGEFLLDVSSIAAACQQAQHIGFARGEAVFASELCTKGVQVRTNVGNRGLLLGFAAYGSMNARRNRLTGLARRTPIARALIRSRHGPRCLRKHAHAVEGAHAAHGCVEAERMRHPEIERGKDEGDARGKQGYAQLVEQAHPRGEHAADKPQRNSEPSRGANHAQHGQGACGAACADSRNKQPYNEGKQRGAYLAQRTRNLGQAGVSHAQGRHEQQPC